MRHLKFKYKITLIYLATGIIWILFSDAVVDNLQINQALLTFIQSIKGIFYVSATALLLYILVDRNSKAEDSIKEKLKESTEKYKSLYDQSPLAYQSLDVDGCFIDINPAWSKTLDYEREEVIGEWFGNFLHPDFTEHFKKNFPVFKKQGYISEVQFQMKKKDGNYIFVSYEGCAEYNPDGSFKQTYCTFKDITTEYLAQQKLKINEKKFKALFYNNRSIMWMLDAETGEIINANQAAIDFYGYSQEELLNMTIFDINTMDNSKLSELFDLVVNNTQNYFQVQHKLKNGKICDVEVYCSNVEIQGKVYIYSIVHDITEKLRTEKELVVARERAERSDNLKSAFLANMSHEIRTPLNGILGFAGLIAEEELPYNTIKKYTQIINSSGHRLLELINNLLDISRIESGNMPVRVSVCSPKNLIDEVTNLFQANAKDKNTTINKVLLSEYEHLRIETDELIINQTLTNLLSNAIKFTHNGKIEIGFIPRENSIEFFVKDNGTGIPHEKQKDLFKRFYQVDLEFAKSQEGSGLGLALCKSLIDLLKGEIWVISKPEVGSDFRFRIPTKVAKTLAKTT